MRKQRALASLTPEEREQLAEEVQKTPYEKVLERIRKPRPEGYGLAKISIPPLFPNGDTYVSPVVAAGNSVAPCGYPGSKAHKTFNPVRVAPQSAARNPAQSLQNLM